jgi:hypothetical protein
VFFKLWIVEPMLLAWDYSVMAKQHT